MSNYVFTKEKWEALNDPLPLLTIGSAEADEVVATFSPLILGEFAIPSAAFGDETLREINDLFGRDHDTPNTDQ